MNPNQITHPPRRLTKWTAAMAVVAAIYGFAMNFLSVQDYVCMEPIGQPAVSDVCGAMGIGHRPRHDERIAWESRPAGSCDVLRGFAADEHSYYQATAAHMLNAATAEQTADYSSVSREWRSYVRMGEQPFATRTAAQTDALARAQVDAVSQGCAPRSESERLDSADVAAAPNGYECRPDPRGGFTCGLNYIAQCHVDERRLVQHCP